MGGLRDRNVLSHHSRGQKSGIEVLVGLVPGRAVREGPDPGLSFTSGGLLVTCGVPGLVETALIPAFMFTWGSLCVSVCIQIPIL